MAYIGITAVIFATVNATRGRFKALPQGDCVRCTLRAAASAGGGKSPRHRTAAGTLPTHRASRRKGKRQGARLRAECNFIYDHTSN